MNFGRIKYIALLLFFFTTNVWAQNNINLDKALTQVYVALSPVSSLSYDLKITTKEAGNTSSVYTANVFENLDSNSYYAFYKLSNKQVLLSYNNSLGIERFWLGRVEDLPEIESRAVDSKFLTTAISYSSLNINPLWLNIAYEAKDDQGFLVIYTYNKNRYSNFSKLEFYLNKDNVPVRILYYNNISNFPVIEVLVTDYKKEGKGYIIYKMEYRDNSSKKVTMLEKTNVVLNPKPPSGFEDAKKLISNNISNYYNSFMLGIRSKQDVLALQESLNKQQISSKESIPSNVVKSNQACKDDSCSGSTTYKDGKVDKNSNHSETTSPTKVISVIPPPAIASKQGDSNDTLLKALDGLNNKPTNKKAPNSKVKSNNKQTNITTNKKSNQKKAQHKQSLTKKKTPKVKNENNLKQPSKNRAITNNKKLNNKTNNTLKQNSKTSNLNNQKNTESLIPLLPVKPNSGIPLKDINNKPKADSKTNNNSAADGTTSKSKDNNNSPSDNEKSNKESKPKQPDQNNSKAKDNTVKQTQETNKLTNEQTEAKDVPSNTEAKQQPDQQESAPAVPPKNDEDNSDNQPNSESQQRPTLNNLF